MAKEQIEYDGIKIYVEEIGPERAKELLNKMPRNRTMNRANLSYIMEEMKRGQFMFTGETIIIDIKGNLINGQHRLESIIRTGKVYPFVVVDGVPQKVFDKLDSGRSRSTGDVLSSLGYKNAPQLATAVRTILLFQQKVYFKYSRADLAKAKATTVDVVNFTKENPKILEYIGFSKEVNAKFRNLAPANIAVLYWFFRQKSVTMADYFFDKIATGDFKDASKQDKAIERTRNKITQYDANNRNKKQGGLSSSTLRDKMAIVILGWNNYRTKRDAPITLEVNYKFPSIV